jgi:DNA processing protein
VSELAAAAYAAATGRHVIDVPSDPEFRRFLTGFDEAAYRERLRARSITWLPRSAPSFPRALAGIFDPPVGLFVRGDVDPSVLDLPAVAVVGARACSTYGRHVARLLGRELAAAGLVVVSGLARGIDGEAHRGALDAEGLTVAVLGCGIDRDYPASHADLARKIGERGLIVSEYGPGVDPAPWRFPARNRIVAGLSQATVVVEARERSGALITADLALEEGRDVFAVPGEITSSLSDGSNGLLALGATPLLTADDVLRAFGLERTALPTTAVEGPAAAVLAVLTDGARAADDLVVATGLDAGTVAAALSELELLGLAAEGEGLFRSLAGR